MSEVVSQRSHREADKHFFLRLEWSGLKHPIQKGRTVIGRAPSCDVLLTEAATSVSRKHAEIQRAGNELRILDLGSRNRTSVNGRDISGAGPVAIGPGDRITICQYEFTLLEEGHELSGTCTIADDSAEDSSRLSVGRSASLAAHQNKQLTALLSISRSLASVLNTQDVLDTAIDTLLDVFPAAERCVIGFVEPEGSFEARWWKLRQPNRSDTITVSMSVVREILTSGESILYEDAVTALPEGDSVLAMNLRSIMCAPLLDAEGQVFGMLQLDSSLASRFDQSDLEVLSAVAIQIGMALNVSRLHGKVVEDLLLLSDLEQARAVQKQFLPTASPDVREYEFADYYSPARHLGGDYFDYIRLGDQRLAIVLGDVVGKGAPAALNMVRLATETRATFEISESPAEVMARLNRRLNGAFVTCVLIVLDTQQHTATITNAGHELPLLKSKDGWVRELGDEATDVPLSVMDHVDYREQTYSVQPGDALFVFSDGFVDAEDSANSARFGRERLQSIVAAPAAKPREIIDSLVHQIQQFTSGSTQFDDMCLVCFQREPPMLARQ